jgi:hypothetical protein
MLGFALSLFILAAILGSIVLAAILKNKPTPKPIAIIHGSLGGFGLLLLLTYLAVAKINALLLSGVAVLLLAMVGGLIMFGIDVSEKPIPKVLAILHPLFAIAGLIMIILYFIQT